MKNKENQWLNYIAISNRREFLENKRFCQVWVLTFIPLFPSLFYDSHHLNQNGVKLFNDKLIDILLNEMDR